LALSFVLGCLAAAWLPALPGWPVLLLMAAAAGVLLAFERFRPAAIALIGALWFLGAAQWQLDRQWPAERAGEIVVVEGRIVELPVRQEDSFRFVLDTRPAGAAPDRAVTLPDRIQVRWYRPGRPPSPGELWRFDLALEPPHGRSNPGGFDFERYLLSRRIGALARVRGEPVQLAEGGWSGWMDRQRQRVSNILLAETVDRDVAALKQALGVADRSGIDEPLSERLRQTGTAHLLAISGLHIGMVAAVGGLVGSWLLAPLALAGRRLDRKRLGLLAGLAVALVYAGLAGFSLPTQRALIMLGVVALALIGRRNLAPARALVLALTAVLLFDPLAPLSAGFWMSFAAVAVLIWAFAWRPGQRSSWWGGLLRAQAVLMVGLLPLNVGLFGQIAPGAVAANLLAIPLVGLFVLPLLLIEVLTILTGLPVTPFAPLNDFLLALLLDGLGWLQAQPLSHLSWPAGVPWAMALAALGGAWLVAPAGWPARSIGLFLMVPLLLPARSAPGEDELRVWFLDVGDGLAAVVRTAEEVVLYDTGPGDGQGGDALSSVLPGIRSRLGVARFDRVVVSHPHRGHAGGLASARSPETVVYGAGGPDSRSCLAGQGWRTGGYRFEFLHPTPGLPDLGGNSSCVLLVAGPGGRVLLTGGIEDAVESRLVDRYGGPRADVVQLPSGGHRDGSSRAFLEAVAPRLAVASVPRFDRWGRVHDSVRDRLDEQGIPVFETGRCGALVVSLAPGRAPKISAIGGSQRRLWRLEGDCPAPGWRQR
jgi:competence protein ComEC